HPFVSILHLVSSVSIPIKRVNLLNHAVSLVSGIEIQLTVGPTRGETGAVVESWVHLEIPPIVLDLGCISDSVGVVVVGYLRSGALRSCGPANSRLRFEKRRVEQLFRSCAEI